VKTFYECFLDKRNSFRVNCYWPYSRFGHLQLGHMENEAVCANNVIMQHCCIVICMSDSRYKVKYYDKTGKVLLFTSFPMMRSSVGSGSWLSDVMKELISRFVWFA
jgi:hypothetical protein